MSKKTMKLSLMAAVSENGRIGSGLKIPWKAEGEQLLFKAMTYNQWLLVGRKTFESMGILPNRRYAVISSTLAPLNRTDVLVYSSVEEALAELPSRTDHVIVAGGGQIYKNLIGHVDILHLTTVHIEVDGDVYFPPVPQYFKKVFTQFFTSNINYTYEIWSR